MWRNPALYYHHFNIVHSSVYFQFARIKWKYLLPSSVLFVPKLGLYRFNIKLSGLSNGSDLERFSNSSWRASYIRKSLWLVRLSANFVDFCSFVKLTQCRTRLDSVRLGWTQFKVMNPVPSLNPFMLSKKILIKWFKVMLSVSQYFTSYKYLKWIKTHC